jgi:hypothetical protein
MGGYPYNGKGTITIDEVHAYSLSAECASGTCRVQALVDGKKGYLEAEGQFVIVSEKVPDGSRIK